MSIVTLARWLGPWANATRSPRAIAVRDTVRDGLRIRTYGARGGQMFLIAPGLHYAGADDPRLDRFCRILAAAGHFVVAPFIPDYLALAPTGRAKRDFVRVFDDLAPPAPPVVFSISFGSLLAFHLAAERGAAIARLVVFGGYRELGATLRYALTGESGARVGPRDPLNQPVVLANLLAHFDPPWPAELALHWRRYVEATWGRAEYKARDRYVAIAERLAAEVPAALRDRYLVGIGVTPGARALVEDALTRFDARELDPGPDLARVRGRVDLVHGTDDDVIPFEQSHALAAALAHADVRVHVTGMYGHTGSAMPSPRALVRELATMVRVLRAMS